MVRQVKVLAAIAAWTLAITLAVQAEPGRWGFACFVAILACIPTFWLMIDLAADAVCKTLREAIQSERQHTEDLVLAVAVEFAQAELPRLSSHRQTPM